MSTATSWRFLALALLALAAPAAPLAAQVPTLDRVDSLITAGAYDDARQTLETWWSARQAFDVPGSDRVRALMLRAQLRQDPRDAEDDYLAIVLGHPTSPHAPEALLRLGQGLLASGQPDRAAGYLQRLAADHPGRPERLPGLLWLARAHTAARRPAAACVAARQGLLDAGSQPEMAAMLRIEEAAACAIGSAAAPARAAAEARQPTTDPRPAPPPAAEPVRDRESDQRRPAPADAAAARGSFAVQSGAFRYREGADALMERLRDAGFEPRAVVVPRNSLLRIRVGRFATAAEAARLVARLRAAGFDAIAVGDADQERAP